MISFKIQQKTYARWFLWLSPNKDGFNHYRYDGCFYTKMKDDGGNASRKKRNTVNNNQDIKIQNDII